MTSNIFLEGLNMHGMVIYTDEELCPYVVWNDGKFYWFSPVTMGPVVVQKREGNA
jgi:hypothetical protein